MKISPALRPLAPAFAISLAASAAALAQEAVTTVSITGSRFESAPGLQVPGATVITADDIRRAGIADANEAIRKLGGVHGRKSLDGSPDYALDLRGFGVNSSQNMVVMLDGVRLSENEFGGPNLSTIPVETIERIEIIRGGASVLFGEGATGGVIHIVTRRPEAGEGRGSARVEAGSFGHRDLRLSASRSAGALAFDAALTRLETDNYRDHNDFALRAFSGGVAWHRGGARAGLRVDSARQQTELPGALSLAQFEANPRQAATPLDNGSLDSDRVSAYAGMRAGALDLAAELVRREKTVRASYFYDFGSGPFESRSRYDMRQDQFSPRVRHLSGSGAVRNELVAGFDWTRWRRLTDAGYSQAQARQVSRAFYVRNEARHGPVRLAAGARRETFDKHYADAMAANPSPESSSQTQHAWELQGSYAASGMLDVHARAGRSYRVPNADENSYRDSTGVLDVQRSHDLELGATLSGAGKELTLRAFRHRIEDEIFFDPTANGGWGANTNLDPTRRQGVELGGHILLPWQLRLGASAQRVSARFTGGPNAGREMVLVPTSKVAARLSWMPEDGHTADIGVQWTGSQRNGGDFSNTCSRRMPAYTTVDARYARTLGRWELAVSALNLTDRQYYSHAFACEGSIYPDDGRQLKLSARYDF